MQRDKMIQVVGGIYAAFGRGDLPAILEVVSEDIEWGYEVNPSLPGVGGVDRMQTFRGRAGVVAYFQTIVNGLEVKKLAIEDILAGEQHAAAVIDHHMLVKETGKSYAGRQIHLWRFAANGLIDRMTHFEDTAQVIAAFAS